MSTTDRLIRKFGVERTHVVRVPQALLGDYSVFGKDFVGIPGPVVALCGVRSLSAKDVGVCMRPGTPLTCRTCRYVSGWGEAPEGNEARRVSTEPPP